MAVSRADVVDANFTRIIGAFRGEMNPEEVDWDRPIREDSALTGREAMALFEAQLESRHIDLASRWLKTLGESFYTIGGSGHEGNAAVAAALQPSDPALLHYRSGAFFLARSQQVPGSHGAFDVLRGCVAAADEPIAGGRHKVFGSVPLAIPPQTSTIASHLPKAVGQAIAMDRRARLADEPEDRIVVCTFGDASSNHASATTAFNAAAWSSWQRVPCPVLFVCEDNGLGISVRTPGGWVAHNLQNRSGLAYFYADGLDLAHAFDAACEAADYVRSTRQPAILHLRTVRMLGHAGSDVEQLYRTKEEIEATEAQDPLLATARMLIEEGFLSSDEVLGLYESTRSRIRALAQEATRRPKLETREAVMEPLFQHREEEIAAVVPVAAPEVRAEMFKSRLPEQQDRKRTLAFQLNRALHDVLAGDPSTIIFGEDVARKGGVYHVTAGLTERFGVGRVFNTLLDETSILGLALGASQAKLLPIAEIQYLAYLMNAIDQLRGEAGSLQFFSQGQFANPAVIRIAGLAYQRGFGGHFHNDNGIAALREIPGLLIGCPSNGADAARMLRTMVAAASAFGRVCVCLEPIALYHMKDLHSDGDEGWLTHYPAPHHHMPVGEVQAYGESGTVCILSFANGLWMSLRVAERLRAERGITVKVVDIRWLQPLPIDSIFKEIAGCDSVLIVDECRANSGIAAELSAEISESDFDGPVARVTAPDTYIPLGAAANLVLVSEDDITSAVVDLHERVKA